MATIEEKIAKKQRRKAAHNKICSDYLKLKEQHPTEPAYSLFETLANKYKAKGLIFFPGTSMGVRNIIIKYGLYQPQR